MHMSEAETRRKLIDKRLWLAGWKVDDPSQVIQELDIYLKDPTASVGAEEKNPYAGHQFADYALLLHGKPAAVVEAKKTTKDAGLGQEQAVQYAERLQKIQGGLLPFVLYTNGHDIHFWEKGFYPPDKVPGFPTHDDLEWLDQRRETRRPLSVEMINTKIVERGYQIEAIRTVLERAEDKQRKFLLVMATGTGKTRVAVALSDVLLRARWAKRVLFLVDRIALRDQARDAFKEHLPSEPRWPQTGEREFARDRRVYVATYPTMLNLIEAGTTPSRWISPYFFDLIVADESHRSIYNIYLQVLKYFNGMKLGLTATPRDHVDHDTFQLFECGKHDPTFEYTFEEAVDHDPPYLCKYEVLNVRSKFQIEGIKGEKLPGVVQKKLIAEGRDIAEIDFEGTDLERKVTNSGTNAVIVREFMDECIKDSSGTLPGKSIIFAISVGHARRLHDLFNEMYPEHAGDLCRVLVSEDSRVHGKGGLLDQFKNQDMPRVAISVDMLDTGVDVREVVNLVFAKPVYSYVKFWQMIGRGTRVLETDPEKRRPWCPEKEKFLIIDCWGNFDYFEMHPPGREPGEQVPLPVKLFRARLDKLVAAMAAKRLDVVHEVTAHLRQDIDALPQNNILVLEHGADLAVVRPDEFWAQINSNKIEFLRTIITPILRARSGADFKAMRFEIDVVEAGTALLSSNQTAFAALRDSIVSQVSELPLGVNVVARERDLIEEAKGAHWWADPNEENLWSLVEHLAPLMKYREQGRGLMVELNLEDLVVTKDWIEVGPDRQRIHTSVYRDKVEEYVRSLLAENPVLQKIMAGESVSEAELGDLADLMAAHGPNITLDTLRKVYDHKTAKFLQLIRHILGLEVLESWSHTVTAAFDDFIAEHTTLTAMQIRFLQTLRTFVLQTGKVGRENLIDAPFTQIHPKGVRGIFRPEEIEEILHFTDGLVA